MKFAVLGFGDSSYEQFCEAARLVNEKLKQLGAHRIYAYTTLDDQYDENPENTVNHWIQEVIQSLLPDKQENTIINEKVKTVDFPSGKCVVKIYKSDQHKEDFILDYKNSEYASQCAIEFNRLIGENKLYLPNEQNSTQIARIVCDMHFAVSSKVWRRKFLEEINLTFIEGMYYEDMVYSITAAIRAKKTSFGAFPIYVYYRNDIKPRYIIEDPNLSNIYTKIKNFFSEKSSEISSDDFIPTVLEIKNFLVKLMDNGSFNALMDFFYYKFDYLYFINFSGTNLYNMKYTIKKLLIIVFNILGVINSPIIENKKLLKISNENLHLKKYFENRINELKRSSIEWPLPEEIKFKPLMTNNEIKAFSSFLKKDNIYFEFGSGGSTNLAFYYKLKKIYSVDSDVRWHSQLKDSNINVTYITVDLKSKPNNLGYPGPETTVEDWKKYVQSYKTEYNADIILIDGRFRVACGLDIFSKIRNNTLVFIHDYNNRKKYHILEKYYIKIISWGTLAGFFKNTNITSIPEEVSNEYINIKY